MTTIILVAIGVLIAAVSALFLVFYGGDAFASNEIRAEAARLVGEGAQVQYATDLFFRQEDRMPGNGVNGTLAMQELLDKNYLSMNPRGANLGDGGNDPWKMTYTDGMIYSRLGDKSEGRAMAVCKEARRQLKYSDYETVYKCDGSDYPRSHPDGTLPDREPCCVKG